MEIDKLYLWLSVSEDYFLQGVVQRSKQLVRFVLHESTIYPPHAQAFKCRKFSSYLPEFDVTSFL